MSKHEQTTQPTVPTSAPAPAPPDECVTGRLLLAWGTSRRTSPPRPVVWLYETGAAGRRYLGEVAESEADAAQPWAQRAHRVMSRLATVDARQQQGDQSLRLELPAALVVRLAERNLATGEGWLFRDPDPAPQG